MENRRLQVLTVNKKLLFLIVLLALSSCYVRPEIYTGRNTLPEHLEESSQSGFRRIPRVYEIRTLPPVNLGMRPEIQAAIQHYTNKDPRYIPLAIKRRSEHLSTLRQIFQDEGVPIELLNLALVESGFRPNARSGSGAVGMWQFMKGTARSYGLTVSFLTDERKDPILSTIAAVRLLRDLYFTYEDWPLALAAYNAGPGRVDRAMIKTGQKDYWELCRQKALSRETRNFVPKILAAAIIEKEPTRYGFNLYEES